MFTKKQILKLTGLTASKLNYLLSNNFFPHIEIKKGLTTYFDFEDLLELKIISKLRKTISFQELKKLKKILFELGESNNLRDKTIISCETHLYLIQKGQLEDWITTQLTGKNAGQIVIRQIIFTNDILDDLQNLGKENDIDLSEYMRTDRNAA